jgi:hypothetical protein
MLDHTFQRVPAAHLRELEHWLRELEAWQEDDPPPPPSAWPQV